MSEFLAACLTLLIPAFIFWIPGLFLVRADDTKNILRTGTYAILGSLAFSTLVSFILAVLHANPVLLFPISAVVGIAALYRNRANAFTLQTAWVSLAVIVPIIFAVGLFAIPFTQKHNALPTGDSQKSIIWAQEIIETHALPRYEKARPLLNRDAGDFYTPGLHTLIASIMDLAPYPLIVVGFFAVYVGVAIAWIAATISRELFDDTPHVIPPLLTALLVLTNFRFLRYIREPGYHLQNVVGELFFIGLLFVSIRLIKRKTWPDLLLWIACLSALIITHQFSTFIAAFALIPLGIAFVVSHVNRRMLVTIITGLVLLAGLAVPFGLYEKLPHLFTTSPHLIGLVPDIIDYPTTLGAIWIIFGLSGLLLLILSSRNTLNSPHIWAFVGSTIILLLLSQGPRFFIDIPPVRALYYSIIPLSICAAYFCMRLRHYIGRVYANSPAMRSLGYILIVGFLAVPMSASTYQAFASSNHVVRTNSTLLPEQIYVSNWLRDQEGTQGVLVDDYNRRSSAWFALSGKPMFTRIAADISRQMNEAKQSQLRRDLYLNQLNYEKIYSLGSQPYITRLMHRQNIAWVTGVMKNSDDAFSHNPALREVVRGNDTVLYTVTEDQNNISDIEAWLLRPSTLANDIGDREDTFAHLPASLRTQRLSDPQFDGNHTLRFTTAPIIPLVFNTTSYVDALWDQDSDSYPDADLSLYITTVAESKSFTLRLPDGSNTKITSGERLTINHTAIQKNEKGLVEIDILNPENELVGIDIIALGLAQVP